MKHISTWTCLFLLILCNSVSYSQKITTGIFSGVNFSDIRGQDFGGKWESKPGPIQGFQIGYSLGKCIGIQTGINFSTVYYQHKTTYYPNVFFEPSYSDYYISPVYYNPTVEKMDFSFLRVPLLFTVSIPSAIQFNMKAGVFFSFMQDHSLSNNYYSYSEPDNTKKNDFGYLFSSGISYPLSDKFKAAFNVSYLMGRKKFLENYNYRHGSSEFTLGIEYEFLKKNKTINNQKLLADSTSKKVTITYWGGVDISWNGLSKDHTKYLACFGPSLGFSLNFPLGHNSAFQTGFFFERKGYSIKDSSSLFYQIVKNGTPVYYVNTKVQTNYAIIPVLMKLTLGKSHRIFLKSGPWLGLRLNARNVGNAYNEVRSETEYTVNKTVIYDDFAKLISDNDFGWIFGTGVSLPVFDKFKVDLALQYSLGFKNSFNKPLFTSQESSSASDYAIRNRTVSFMIGFTIPPANH